MELSQRREVPRLRRKDKHEGEKPFSHTPIRLPIKPSQRMTSDSTVKSKLDSSGTLKGL